MLGTGTSNQFSIVNGRASSRSSWNVRLRPLRLGRLEIPPITVGSDQTWPLSIEVSEIPETLESQQNAHAFIEVEAPHDGPSRAGDNDADGRAGQPTRDVGPKELEISEQWSNKS